MPIYIFQNRDSDLHAYSVDKTGANIPMQDDVRYCWFLRGAVDDFASLPPSLPQRAMSDLLDFGFHVFTQLSASR